MSAVAAVDRVATIQALVQQLCGAPRGDFQAQLAAARSTAPSGPTASVASLAGPGLGAGAPVGSGAGAPVGAGIGAGGIGGAGAATGADAGGAPTPYAGLIDAAAARWGVDPNVLRGLIRQESDFDPTSTSSAGAQGLCQLMPGTASGLGVTDPFDPAQSIDGGAHELHDQLARFGGDYVKALAAYNAGPGAVERYGGVPPYAETQAYVRKVLGYAAEYGTQSGTGATTI